MSTNELESVSLQEMYPELSGRIAHGTLASGELVFSAPDSHLQFHPQITEAILREALTKVTWPAETPPGTPRGLKADMREHPLGKSEVIEVPDRDGIQVVWAPRVDAAGKPTHTRIADDGSTEVMYSPWVVGLNDEEKNNIPLVDVVTVALKELPERTTPQRWLELRSAFPGNAPREVGTNFNLSPFGKDAAWEFWCGVKPNGIRVSRGHAFVFDSSQPPFDLNEGLRNGTVLTECPYRP